MTAINYELPPQRILDIIKDFEIALRLKQNKQRPQVEKKTITYHNTGSVGSTVLESTDVVLQAPINVTAPLDTVKQPELIVSLSHIEYPTQGVGVVQVAVFKTITPDSDPAKPPKVESKTRHYYKTAAEKTDRSYKVTLRDLRVLADDALTFLLTGKTPE